MFYSKIFHLHSRENFVPNFIYVLYLSKVLKARLCWSYEKELGIAFACSRTAY